MMDRKFIKKLRKVLVLEALFHGASSFSKVLDATESDLADIMKYFDKKGSKKELPVGKPNKK